MSLPANDVNEIRDHDDIGASHRWLSKFSHGSCRYSRYRSSKIPSRHFDQRLNEHQTWLETPDQKSEPNARPKLVSKWERTQVSAQHISSRSCAFVMEVPKLVLRWEQILVSAQTTSSRSYAFVMEVSKVVLRWEQTQVSAQRSSSGTIQIGRKCSLDPVDVSGRSLHGS